MKSVVTPEIQIFPDEEALAGFALSVWNSASRAAVAERGRFSVALSGGKTPVPFYRKLAVSPNLPWRYTHLFWADERLVPADHEESNFRLVRENLLSGIAIPPGNVHSPPVSGGSPPAVAGRYEEEIRSYFRLPPGQTPVFDLIMLGLGEDGHTASLFPGSSLLGEKTRWIAAETSPSISPARITLTLPVINASARAVFLVSGRKKAGVLKRVVEDRDERLPASLVRPVSGRLVFAMDREAGRLLGKISESALPG